MKILSADDRMVTCELEAAEALAGLSRCSAAFRNVTESEISFKQDHSKDREVAAGNLCEKTSTTVTSALKSEEAVRTLPDQKSSSSYQSNFASKFRRNSTEADKEAKRLRRVLANRESARQTIRRRQAMHLELTKKAAALLEENENLKKKKDVAVEEYNSLKNRNEFLKVEMARIKKPEPRNVQEEAKLSQAEIPTSNTPVYLYNHPSFVPFFWPNVFQFQYAPHSDIMCSAQIPMQHSDVAPFVLPLPWLFPVLSHNNQFNSQSGNNERRDETSLTHQCSVSSSSDNHQMSSNQDTRMRVPFIGSGCDRPSEILKPTRESEGGDTYNHSVISAPERKSRGLLKKSKEPRICCQKVPEYALAVTTARRKRKELLRLRNIRLLS